MKLKIKVTKEILEMTKMCGDRSFRLPYSKTTSTAENCAITGACRELFPECRTTSVAIIFPLADIAIPLPKEATLFIVMFDASNPKQRIKMKPIEFEVELPEVLINLINIDEAKAIIEKSTTLELVD